MQNVDRVQYGKYYEFIVFGPSILEFRCDNEVTLGTPSSVFRSHDILKLFTLVNQLQVPR